MVIKVVWRPYFMNKSRKNSNSKGCKTTYHDFTKKRNFGPKMSEFWTSQNFPEPNVYFLWKNTSKVNPRTKKKKIAAFTKPTKSEYS